MTHRHQLKVSEWWLATFPPPAPLQVDPGKIPLNNYPVPMSSNATRWTKLWWTIAIMEPYFATDNSRYPSWKRQTLTLLYFAFNKIYPFKCSTVSISDNQTPPFPKKKEKYKKRRDEKNMQAIWSDGLRCVCSTVWGHQCFLPQKKTGDGKMISYFFCKTCIGESSPKELVS